MTKNWLVTYYDKNNKIIGTPYEIKDRTEHEAENEAMADMPSNADDWTMIPIKSTIQKNESRL